MYVLGDYDMLHIQELWLIRVWCSRNLVFDAQNITRPNEEVGVEGKGYVLGVIAALLCGS